MLALIRRQSYLILLFLVWGALLVFVGIPELLSVIDREWNVSFTMLFASFIAGATSLGGGAVAFPVLTKVLEVPPHDAMLFSIAIQSIGMTAASFLIISKNIKVHYQLIPTTFAGCIVGFTGSYFLFRPILSPTSIKLMFTLFSILIAVCLLIKIFKSKSETRTFRRIKIKRSNLFFTGVLGGLITSFIGTGADFIFFTYLAFIPSYNIKSSTASSVVLMALTSVYASFLIFFTTDAFTSDIQMMWLAAIPVVIIGAPLGAYFCKKVDEKVTVGIVFFLVLVESTSTFLLVPISGNTFMLMLMATVISILLLLKYKPNQRQN